MSLQHFILTRFNLDTPFSKNEIFLDENWLNTRLELFEKYCLPSIQTQTNQNFQWLVFMHPETSGSFKKRLSNQISTLPNARLIELTSFQEGNLINALQNLTEKDYSHLLTTRFDSDDAIHPDFVSCLHKAVELNNERNVLNFPTGVILSQQKALAYLHKSNPFISLLEPIDDFIGVFHDSFVNLPKHGKLQQLRLANAFIQVVHDDNAWNEENGYWLGKELLKEYDWLHVDLEQPNVLRKRVNKARWKRRLHKGL